MSKLTKLMNDRARLYLDNHLDTEKLDIINTQIFNILSARADKPKPMKKVVSYEGNTYRLQSYDGIIAKYVLSRKWEESAYVYKEVLPMQRFSNETKTKLLLDIADSSD